jgi:sulfur dioxygenase
MTVRGASGRRACRTNVAEAQEHLAQRGLVQLFDGASSSFTYIVFDEAAWEAAIIDPVDEQLDRDLAVLADLSLSLKWVLETHVHADHVTSAASLARRTGARIAVPARSGVHGAPRMLEDGDVITFGRQSLTALGTPGHTAESMSYLWAADGVDHVFTGDTLLIEGCGRTDFQSGSASVLYDSIKHVLFALPDATQVWPGHDYAGRTASTIGHEKRFNPRIAGKRKADFVATMNALRLPPPRRIDTAVPFNLRLGDRYQS